MSSHSRNVLPADDPSKFLLDRPLDTQRMPPAHCDFFDVLRTYPKPTPDAAVQPPVSGRVLEFGPNLRKINGWNQRHCETENRSHFHDVSREIVRPKDKVQIVGNLIKELRRGLGVSQSELARKLQAKPSSVSKWEAGQNLPNPDMLVNLARIAEGPRKLAFLEMAGVPEAFFYGDPMLPEMLYAATQTIARAFSDDDEGSSKDLPTPPTVPTIPLVRDPWKVGTLEAVQPANIECMLPLISGWIPENGRIQAARFPNPGSPILGADLIGLIDINRRDPDRLIGRVVAVRSHDGLIPMRLRKDGVTYLLEPLQPGSSAQVVRHSGEGSIVGRIVKWIADAPAPEAPQSATAAIHRRRRVGA